MHGQPLNRARYVALYLQLPVSLYCLSEQRRHWRDCSDLFFFAVSVIEYVVYKSICLYGDLRPSQPFYQRIAGHLFFIAVSVIDCVVYKLKHLLVWSFTTPSTLLRSC